VAKAPARRLKVFQAQFGFHDSVVAAPSQVAALAAWGTRQNLFAERRAKVTDDPHAVAAALAHPEVPLRRAVGSNDPFSLEPGPPQAPAGPSRPKPGLKLVAKGAAPPPAPAFKPPDRSGLAAAEQRLTALNTERLAEEAAFQRRREAMEADALAARQRWAKARKAAQDDLAKAQRAYRAQGGEA
jgi:hypothetical protein